MRFLSIRGSINALEEANLRSEMLSDGLQELLTAARHAVMMIAEEDSGALQEQLNLLKTKLANAAGAEELQPAMRDVVEELDRFARNRAQARERMEWEYKQIIRMLAEAGSAMARTGSQHSEELIELAAKVEGASNLENIAEVRHELKGRVAEIKTLAVRVQDQGRDKANSLEMKIRQIEARLKTAEKMVETDPLTGLGNRRMAENAVEAAIAKGHPFTLLVCDLNDFKSVNDKYGHHQGDCLLKSLAQELKSAVRDTDTVCRWGGDEFVVLLHNTRLVDFQSRRDVFEKAAFGDFLVTRNGRESRIRVTASVGAAEYQPGESSTAFFQRADQQMYEKKSERKASLWAVS